MDFSMGMDWKNEFIDFQNQDKFCIESLFLRFSVRNVALVNMRSAMAGEGKMPRTDLATLSVCGNFT